MNAKNKALAHIKKLDVYLEKIFGKVQHLSPANRELVAQSWPIMALIFGAIQLYWAWVLWGITRYTIPDSDFYDRIYVQYPDVIQGVEKLVFYMGILILVAEAVILFIAYSKLKARARSGWNLLFLAMAINTLNAFLSLFISERGFASFVFGMLSSIIGFYLLYEVRGKYGYVKSNKK